MKMHRVATSIALGLVAVACQRKEGPPPGEAAAPPAWLTNYAKAQARARAENKMLLINFTGSDWCPPCLFLHRQILSQPEFVDYAAKNLVLLEVDFPHHKAQSDAQKVANEKLANQYGIDGFPTIILLDSSGKKIGEGGYQAGGPKPFIAGIERLRLGGATSPPSR
jgi:thioredoxin-related protein